MPLVRISLTKQDGRVGLGRQVGEIVYRAMVETINVPEKDNFQIVTEHEPGQIVYDPEYLGIARSDGIVMIQVTLNEGRTTELKKAFYKAVVGRPERPARHPAGRRLHQPGRGEEGELVVRPRRGAVRLLTRPRQAACRLPAPSPDTRPP